MKGEARMPIKPPHDGRMLVRRVIVEDHVDDLSRRNIRLDRVEETNELLMPMALHAAPDNLALDHVERGKEACSHTQSMRQITAFGNPPNASFH